MTAPFDLESLKYRGEGDSLEFKREQYKVWDPDPAVQKKNRSELVKDILAMANSWASEERLIVLGVDAPTNGERRFLGVGQHIDDATIQQMVHGRINRPLALRYATYDFEGVSLGVIHIPSGQQRPFYLDKAFEDLQKGAAYIRRGSSTTMADLDEVAKMGAAAILAPDVSVWLVAEGHAKTLSLIRYEDPPPPPPVPPELERVAASFRAMSLASRIPTFPTPNFGPSKAELADHKKECALLAEVAFVVRNEGTAALDDAKIRALVRPQSGLRVLEEMPDEPTGPARIANLRAPFWQAQKTATVYETGEGWVIEAAVGTVRPTDEVASAEFVLGSDRATVLSVEVQVVDAKLPRGFRTTIEVPINVDQKVLPGARDDDEGDEDDEP